MNSAQRESEETHTEQEVEMRKHRKRMQNTAKTKQSPNKKRMGMFVCNESHFHTYTDNTFTYIYMKDAQNINTLQ